MTNEIQWKDGAVCYAAGVQWFFHYEDSIISETGQVFTFSEIIRFDSLQLNEIRTGDFIAASELDTEQKYNDVVEVLELFGFENHSLYEHVGTYNLICSRKAIAIIEEKHLGDSRQLTYQQIMTIGKLKRMIDERDKLTETTCKSDRGEDSGFSCDYYKVHIDEPTTGSEPYTAECNDLIEALDMTYAEANMFKEIWRTASARTLGKKKAGHTSRRGAEKIIFFAERHGIKHGVKND